MTPRMPSITRLFGIELEFMLLDRQGEVSNTADQLIKDLKKKLHETTIAKECSQAWIEIVSFPHRSSKEVFSGFFKDFEKILYEADVNDLRLFYYGTYPGKNKGKLRSDARYESQRKIRGNERMSIASKCIGFHFHYSLPRNVLNKNILFFYPDLNSRKKRQVLNLHNSYVAIDPAITTFMQSSPYYEGKYYGKDARMMLYRDDRIFGLKNKYYSGYSQYKKLNNYHPSFKELADTIKKRAEDWKNILTEHETSFKDFTKKGRKPSLLDTCWKPVKISPHSTIESRGADMNSLNKIVAMSSIMKHFSKYIQREVKEVKPSSIGNEEPFTYEEGFLHVPQREYIDILQKSSAFNGFEDENVRMYCKSLLKFVKSITSVESMAPIRVFNKMLNEKKTTSDEIIDFVKKKQGKENYKTIEQETARDLALKSSQDLYKDLIITKEMAKQNLIFG